MASRQFVDWSDSTVAALMKSFILKEEDAPKSVRLLADRLSEYLGWNVGSSVVQRRIVKERSNFSISTPAPTVNENRQHQKAEEPRHDF